MSGSLEKNESVCSAGVGTVQIMNVGSHDKQLHSEWKEEKENMPSNFSKSDLRECRTTPTVGNDPNISDDEEDFMSSLKELNKIRDLKRREAMRKEKAHKRKGRVGFLAFMGFVLSGVFAEVYINHLSRLVILFKRLILDAQR
ncbi:hypothetical protein PIB30_011732 [Stylosanthes scabra]|uniref:Uncharacterized protein n=1 Tax=Stylosanthes scabra TaxID=79078 RepID=A0ABU6Z5G5_9FABA|nr:hypothetical protein [Stylosanthes scabra]